MSRYSQARSIAVELNAEHERGLKKAPNAARLLAALDGAEWSEDPALFAARVRAREDAHHAVATWQDMDEVRVLEHLRMCGVGK